MGTARVRKKGNRLEALINFAPAGVSKIADETYALVKAEILSAFRSDSRRSTAPLPDGGQKFTKWELPEISIIAVPANPSALVVQRRYSRAGEGRVISGENADHLTALRECMRRPRAVHIDLANKSDELTEINSARRSALARMQALREKCQSHLLAPSGAPRTRTPNSPPSSHDKS